MRLSNENDLLSAIFDQHTVRALAGRLIETWPDFPYEDFLTETLRNIDGLATAHRIRRIKESLEHFLPADKAVAIQILADSNGDILSVARQNDWDMALLHALLDAWLSTEKKRPVCTRQNGMWMPAAV